MRLRDLGALVACAVSLAGCASWKPKPPTPAPPVVTPEVTPAPVAAPVVVRVPVPVKTPCVPKGFPRAPRYPDTDAALLDAGGAADRYQLMAAGRLLRDHRLADLEKVLEGCR